MIVSLLALEDEPNRLGTQQAPQTRPPVLTACMHNLIDPRHEFVKRIR